MNEPYEITVFENSPDGEVLSRAEMPYEIGLEWRVLGYRNRVERWIFGQWRELALYHSKQGARYLAFRIRHRDSEEWIALGLSGPVPVGARPSTIERGR